MSRTAPFPSAINAAHPEPWPARPPHRTFRRPPRALPLASKRFIGNTNAVPPEGSRSVRDSSHWPARALRFVIPPCCVTRDGNIVTRWSQPARLAGHLKSRTCRTRESPRVPLPPRELTIPFRRFEGILSRELQDARHTFGGRRGRHSAAAWRGPEGTRPPRIACR